MVVLDMLEEQGEVRLPVKSLASSVSSFLTNRLIVSGKRNRVSFCVELRFKNADSFHPPSLVKSLPFVTNPGIPGNRYSKKLELFSTLLDTTPRLQTLLYRSAGAMLVVMSPTPDTRRQAPRATRTMRESKKFFQIFSRPARSATNPTGTSHFQKRTNSSN